MNKWSVKECQDILECAIGEVDHHIPEDVIEQTIDYLNELKTTKKELRKLKKETEDQFSNMMWEKYPDGGY